MSEGCGPLRGTSLRLTSRLTALVLAACVVLDADALAQADRPAPEAPPPIEIGELVPGVPVEQTIASSQSHAHGLLLDAGDFVHVVLEQQGIDVAATLVGPDGGAIVSADEFDDSFREETIAAIAATGGRYRVTVRPVADAEPVGRYTIRIDDRRPWQAEDGLRVEAERAFAHAVHSRSRDARPTLTAALAELQSALDGYRRAADRRGEMKTLIEIGATEYYLLRPEAQHTAERAESMARALGDPAAIARTLRLLGNILVWRDDLRTAAIRLEEATALSRAAGNERGQVRSLNDTGRVYWRIGELERAATAFEQGASLARAGSARDLEATLLGNLGLVFKLLGDNARARELYERALDDSRRDTDLLGQIINLINLGNLDRAAAEYGSALRRHEEALSLARMTGAVSKEATALSAIGLTHQARGDSAAALAFHRESLAIRQQLGDVSGQGVSLASIGRDLMGLGRLEEAADAFDGALALHRAVRDEMAESDTLRELALLERNRGNAAAALRDIRSAVALDERVRRRISSPELRASFGSTGTGKYELLIDLLQRQHESAPLGGHDAAALEVSERARARVLLESLLDARVDLHQGIEPALLARERGLQGELADASADFSKALAAKDANGQTAASRKFQELSDEYDDLQRRIRRQSPRYAALTQPEPLTLAEIQREVLDRDTVLLEFAPGEDSSWLWAVTPDTITSVELPPRQQLEAAARALYEQITARQPRTAEPYPAYSRRVAASERRAVQQLAAVSHMLFGGIARELNGAWRGKRLLIVASGALEYLPFAALPAPAAAPVSSAAPVPLVARHEIVTVPSASVLLTLRREAAGREPAAPLIAVLADPVFEAGDPRVNRRRSRTFDAEAGAGDTSRTAAPYRPTTRAVQRIQEAAGRAGVARLPFSREEADAIEALAGTTPVVTATDFEASRSTALGREVSTARIVHFATHGWLDPDHPDLTGLVLSLVDERGAPRDGFLPLRDIYNMRLAADLVVLSACQTALGEEVSGEGLVSLTRAFMYAGAPRVIASLWQVSDVATAELMERLYEGILTRGLTPAAALRAAQLEMSRDARWASPFFWSGFVLQGDWE